MAILALLEAITFIPASATAAMEAKTPDWPDTSAVHRTRVTRTPDFHHVRATLQRLMRTKHAKGRNHFCVLGQRTAWRYNFAWVFWPEQHALILWEPGDTGIDDLTRSKRYLDLYRDVVPTDADIRGSSYLISRPWLEQMRADCKRYGDSFVIDAGR